MDVTLRKRTTDGYDPPIPVAGKEFVVGKGASCQLRIDAPEVSERHCVAVIRTQGDRVLIADLDSDPGARRSTTARSWNRSKSATATTRSGSGRRGSSSASRPRARPPKRAEPGAAPKRGKAAGSGKWCPVEDRGERPGRRLAGQGPRQRVDHGPGDRRVHGRVEPGDRGGANAPRSCARLRERQAHVEPGDRRGPPGESALCGGGGQVQALHDPAPGGRRLRHHGDEPPRRPAQATSTSSRQHARQRLAEAGGAAAKPRAVKPQPGPAPRVPAVGDVRTSPLNARRF